MLYIAQDKHQTFGMVRFVVDAKSNKQDKIEYTKRVIRSHKSKDRQYNDQHTKD